MLLPIKKDEAVGLFNLINHFHERALVIITTNMSPTEWAQTHNLDRTKNVGPVYSSKAF